ncbi:PD-(D/E)XK nuclease family protein [Mesotoga prima]|uniref:PD-(D/E)XK nuclease family protein n=1 Tax=Mesotoga prima TaxID=1184387 RepID=UPI002FDB5016
MKGILVCGKEGRRRSDYLLQKIQESYSGDPFSFLFVGPSSFFLRTVKDSLVKRGLSIAAGQFSTERSLAMKIVREMFPDRRAVPERGERIEIAKAFEKVKNYYPSEKATSYFHEAIVVLKENLGNFETAFGREDVVPEVLKKVYAELQEHFEEGKLFDSYDAMRLAAEQTDLERGAFGKTLFIDGFYDFSPATRAFLKNIMRCFDEVYLSCPEDSDRKNLFRESQTISALFEGIDFDTINVDRSEIGPLTKVKEILFSDREEFNDTGCENAEIVECNDLYGEVDFVAREVKRAIAKGELKPEEIEIVIPNQDYWRVLKKSLNDFGIPVVSKNSVSLLESKSIQTLLLPLEVVSGSFEPSGILEMMDAGYGGGTIDSVLFEKVMASAGLQFEMSGATAEDAKKVWLEKLETYKRFLDAKSESLASNDDLDEDFSALSQIQEIKEEIRFIEYAAKPAVKRVFSLLKSIERNVSMPLSKYEAFFRVCEERLGLKELTGNKEKTLVSENIACVEQFIQRAVPSHAGILEAMEITEYDPEKYYKSLIKYLEGEDLRGEANMGGGVEVLSLIDSRYTSKKVKYFMGFNEGNYPVLSLNPLYAGAQYSEPRAKDILGIQENRQKLGLFLAISGAQERLCITFSNSTVDGNVLMKSPYEGSVLGAFGKSEPKPHGRVEGKRTDLVSSPSESMSPADYRLSIASLFKESPEEWEKHKDSEIVATLEKNLSSITNDFSFKVPGVKAAEELTEKCISFSTVGTYCKCKFKYFLNYVLGLQPVPEEILELSPMDAGSVFHAVLSDHLGSGVPLDESLEKNLRRFSGGINKALFKRRYDQMLKILTEYVDYDQSEETSAGRTVFRTELSFGFDTSDYGPLKLTPEICVHGIVDRIDTCEDGTLFVIDYKSGKSLGSAMAEQLILYSMAVENAFSEENKVVSGGEFRLIKGKNKRNNFSIDYSSGERKWKFFGGLKFNICDTAEKGKISDDEFIGAVEEIIKSIQSGDFSIETWKGKASSCYGCENEGIFNILKWRQKGGPSDE